MRHSTVDVSPAVPVRVPPTPPEVATVKWPGVPAIVRRVAVTRLPAIASEKGKVTGVAPFRATVPKFFCPVTEYGVTHSFSGARIPDQQRAVASVILTPFVGAEPDTEISLMSITVPAPL